MPYILQGTRWVHITNSAEILQTESINPDWVRWVETAGELEALLMAQDGLQEGLTKYQRDNQSETSRVQVLAEPMVSAGSLEAVLTVARSMSGINLQIPDWLYTEIHDQENQDRHIRHTDGRIIVEGEFIVEWRKITHSPTAAKKLSTGRKRRETIRTKRATVNLSTVKSIVENMRDLTVRTLCPEWQARTQELRCFHYDWKELHAMFENALQAGKRFKIKFYTSKQIVSELRSIHTNALAKWLVSENPQEVAFATWGNKMLAAARKAEKAEAKVMKKSEKSEKVAEPA
jgi:hypothetical protein